MCTGKSHGVSNSGYLLRGQGLGFGEVVIWYVVYGIECVGRGEVICDPKASIYNVFG